MWKNDEKERYPFHFMKGKKEKSVSMDTLHDSPDVFWGMKTVYATPEMFLNRKPCYRIILEDMDSPGKTFQSFLHDSILVGRDKDCGIVLADDVYIARRHCRIILRNESFYVEDMQSMNGTYLNGVRIMEETEIVSGDVLKIGKTSLRFHYEIQNQ